MKLSKFSTLVLSGFISVNGLFLLFPIEKVDARPCGHTWLAKAGCAIDPTNPDRNGGRIQRLDPTTPNSPGGKFVRKTVPVACGVAGAIASSPGVLATVGGAAAGHKTCYKIINQMQH